MGILRILLRSIQGGLFPGGGKLLGSPCNKAIQCITTPGYGHSNHTGLDWNHSAYDWILTLRMSDVITWKYDFLALAMDGACGWDMVRRGNKAK